MRTIFAVSVFCLVGAFAPATIAGQAPQPSLQEASGLLKGVTFPVSYTGESLANLSGGYRQGAIYEGLLSAGIQLDLDKLVAWKGSSFLISSLYPHGPSLTEHYVHDFNGVSSIDAYDSVRLYEAWFQQEFADGKLSIRAGQVLADTEFFVSDYGALFLNSAFGAIPLVSQNFDAPVFPVAVPGARVRVMASEALSLQFGVFDGGTDGTGSDNKHGVQWNLNSNQGWLTIAEMAYRLNTQKDGKGLQGVYKLGGFYHSARFEDNEPGLREDSCDFGGYFIADQQLWQQAADDDRGLSCFFRIGVAPSDRSRVPFYCDGGFNYKGLLPGRKDDLAGIGCSYTKLSTDLHDEDGEALQSHYETILEATYKATLNEWCSMQPDFQCVFNPGARHNAPTALVAGIRFNLSFH